MLPLDHSDFLLLNRGGDRGIYCRDWFVCVGEDCEVGVGDGGLLVRGEERGMSL